MSLFSHDARRFKFEVLKAVSERAYQGTLTVNSSEEIAHLLIPTTRADYRCCVYKEREVIRERVRMAMGFNPDPHLKTKSINQIVHVLEAACDGCSIKKIHITDSCRKCMGKSCLSACKFNAIKAGPNSMFIDYSTCKECGACAKVCPYHAIIETVRPCKQACAVDAISWDENDIARIDLSKCINCGACQSACPFGAIEDISWIVPVVELLKLNTPTTSVIAPSIQGQFKQATLNQIITGLKQLGFNQVVEAAVGADVIAWYEAQEAHQARQEQRVLTTSCCPAFAKMAEIHYPTVYQNNVSHLVSPMLVIGRWIKHYQPGTGVVFIGPCVAKKLEAIQNHSQPDIDYVLTFEELLALFESRGIDCTTLPSTTSETVSAHGRGFALGGGVANAVNQALQEQALPPVSTYFADGIQECKKALLMIKHNKSDYQLLEGMTCKGGCINGPAVIENQTTAIKQLKSENSTITQSISATIKQNDFHQISLAKGVSNVNH
jgi:ferredoxin hydrogenase large subunit